METINTLTTATQLAPITVDRLGRGEIKAAALLLSRSFVHEALFGGYVFDGKEEGAMVQAMQSWFRAWLRSFAPHGEIHTARRDGELVGVAIRMAPGVYPARGMAKATFMLRVMRSVLRMGFTSRRAFKLPAIADGFGKLEPKEPFWHLAWIGVAPEHHRSGVGSALADEAVRVANEHPAPAWLLTFGAHTRRIYERRGFEVDCEIQPCPDGPRGWTMRREAVGRLT